MNRREFVILSICSACAGSTLADPSTNKTLDIGSPADFPREGLYDKLLKSHKLLIFRDKIRLVAFSAICTHRNCTVKPAGDELRCPCHGSKYAIDGEVIKGPAQYSLEHFRIELKEGRILVDRSIGYRESHWDDEGAWVNVG